MKNITVLLICTCLSFGIKAQSILGAWETSTTSENGDELKTVLIVADGYHSFTTHNPNTGEFISSRGGSWKLEEDTITEKLEFDSENSEDVGTKASYKVVITDTVLELIKNDIKLTRIDNGSPGDLQGAWLMSGRIIGDETQLRDTSKPRKTMKILSGTRFQWIAYNTETKEFMGSGGGTYTTKNGGYNENIGFFSRDKSKAGINLNFNYELIDGDWHHSGFSSNGDIIHEIWSIRE